MHKKLGEADGAEARKDSIHMRWKNLGLDLSVMRTATHKVVTGKQRTGRSETEEGKLW